MKATLSAHDILRFRRRYASWQIDQVFLQEIEVSHLGLIDTASG